MTNDELIEIEERAKAATDGPWRTTKCRMRIAVGSAEELDNPRREIGAMTIATFGGYRLAEVKANADFIVSARTDVPLLIAEVRRLKAALSES